MSDNICKICNAEKAESSFLFGEYGPVQVRVDLCNVCYDQFPDYNFVVETGDPLWEPEIAFSSKDLAEAVEIYNVLKKHRMHVKLLFRVGENYVQDEYVQEIEI